jgi:hypothetical protein
LVREYLEARVSAMQIDAGPSEVDRALSFGADDMVYEHNQYRIEGKENHKRGMSAYLGLTKDVRLRLGKMLSNQDVVVAEVEMNFLAKQDDGSWEPSSRKNITVFQIKGGKITRIVDY